MYKNSHPLAGFGDGALGGKSINEPFSDSSGPGDYWWPAPNPLNPPLSQDDQKNMVLCCVFRFCGTTPSFLPTSFPNLPSLFSSSSLPRQEVVALGYLCDTFPVIL